MGFDVRGLAPRSEQGRQFRNTISWWHPLAEYVLDHVAFAECDRREWHSNHGYEIPDESAQVISERLLGLIESGDTAAFARRRERHLAELPDENCPHCEGRGQSDRGTCVGCNGSGRRRPWLTNYQFSVENVAAFAVFCGESGGFKIC